MFDFVFWFEKISGPGVIRILSVKEIVQINVYKVYKLQSNRQQKENDHNQTKTNMYSDCVVNYDKKTLYRNRQLNQY